MTDKNLEKKFDFKIEPKSKEHYMVENSQIEELAPTIPADPSPELIKELLGTLPAKIEFLKMKLVECKKQIQDYKILIKGKRQVLEIEKSKIRQKHQQEYNEANKKFAGNYKKNFIDKPKEDEGKKNQKNAITKVAIQELIKVLRPEKPTKNDLDDLANLETENLQYEILNLEVEMNKVEEYYEYLQVKSEKYENVFISARALKGILVEEMKNGI